MSASLDAPAGIFTNPGPAQEPMTIREHAQAILAIAGRDGVLSPDEQRDIRDLVMGLQQIGQQRVASVMDTQGQPSMPSDETEAAFAEGGGMSDTEEPEDGAEFGGTY